MSTLHEQVREQVKKKPKWTTLIIIDSQAVKNTCNASVDFFGMRVSTKQPMGLKDI